jgi:uncharacterized protein YdaU (DUF1376 family)
MNGPESSEPFDVGGLPGPRHHSTQRNMPMSKGHIARIAPSRKSQTRAKSKSSKTSYPWYKRYAEDYRKGTRHLSLAARGAYSDILDRMYMEGGAIRDDDFEIACELRVKMRVWLRVREELFKAKKLISRKGFIYNERVEEELSERKSAQKVRRSSEAGVKLLRVKSNEINGRESTEPEPEPESDTELEKDKPASSAARLQPPKDLATDPASLRADDRVISDLIRWHPSHDEVQARLWLNGMLEQFGEGPMRLSYNDLKVEIAQGKARVPIKLWPIIALRKFKNPEQGPKRTLRKAERTARALRANKVNVSE